jgi:hypothetical protein
MATVDTTRRQHSSVPPRTMSAVVPVPVPGTVPPLRIETDTFVPELTVDGWVRNGAAARTGGLLTTLDGRRFLLRDAIRVLGRRNGDTDPYGFTGKVEPIREFIRRGASVSADGLRLGPAVYDVEYGFVTIAG